MTTRTGRWDSTWQMRAWYRLIRASAAIHHALHRKAMP